MSLRNGKNYKMKNEMVYDYLNAAILKGDFRPGARIVIRDIAQKLDVSDIPVREAIKLLEAQGLVSVKPHIGPRVRDFTLKELEEVMAIRSHLEELAVQLASEHADEAALQGMSRLISKMEKIITAKKFDKYGELNTAFHLEMCRRLPYPLLFELISDLYAKSRIMRTIFAQSPKRCRDSLMEHREILRTLEKRDTPKALELIKEHSKAAWNELRKYIPE